MEHTPFLEEADMRFPANGKASDSSGPEGGRREVTHGGQRKVVNRPLDFILRLKLKQDGFAEGDFEAPDREQACRWMADHMRPAIGDYLCDLEGTKRRVAISVWLADTVANANGHLSNEVLRQILAEKPERLDRFLDNPDDRQWDSYTFPSCKDVAARLRIHPSNVTRWRQQIEADVDNCLKERWLATVPGSVREAAVERSQTTRSDGDEEKKEEEGSCQAKSESRSNAT